MLRLVSDVLPTLMLYASRTFRLVSPVLSGWISILTVKSFISRCLLLLCNLSFMYADCVVFVTFCREVSRLYNKSKTTYAFYTQFYQEFKCNLFLFG